jgi:Zn-finger protein
MANKREIKKDVDYLVGEVISDCYTYLMIHGEKNRDKVIDIIGSIVEKRNDLIGRVNNHDKSFDSKQIKAHYKAINVDLLAAIDDSFSKLSKLSAKK